MKYTTLLLLGVISATAPRDNRLTQLNSKMSVNEVADASDSDSADETLVMWTEKFGEGDDGVVDALTQPLGNCDERLWMSNEEMEWQNDMFSRTFDRKYYDNVQKIAKELNMNPPKVHAWELLNDSFAFPRVRRYDFVQNQMDMLEHFQDNFNMNKSNQINVDNLIRVGKTVNTNFSAKYHDGEFDNPKSHDPRMEALHKHNGQFDAQASTEKGVMKFF